MPAGDPGTDSPAGPDSADAAGPSSRGPGLAKPFRRRPDPVTRPDPDADDRAHAAFVLACMGLVFATVFAVPVAFLRGGPAPAHAGPATGPAPVSAANDAPAAAAAVPRPLSEADLTAVGEDDEPTAAPAQPPLQTIADACRRLPGYGTVFVEPSEGEAGVTVQEGTFGRRSFYTLVKDGTRNLEAVAQIQDAVRRLSLFDFRRIQPDDRFRLFLDENGRIRMFEYAPSETEMFHVVRTGESSFVAHRVDVPVETRVARFAGTVDASLGRSLVAAGLDAGIMPLITDIFSFAADFSRDARPGDRFRLAVEERWIGGRFNRYTRVLGFDYVGAVIGELHAYAFDVGGRTRYFAPDGSSVQRVFLTAPCRYEAISSRFDLHRMHPILNRRMPHEGVDLVAPSGTPVYAIADGTLAFHGERGPNGNLVILEHAGDMLSYYAHLSAFASGLRDGGAIRKGQLIGYVGTTGRSTGPHLHFGIKVNGTFVDPEAYLKSRRGQPVAPEQAEAFRAAVAAIDAELNQVAMPAGAAPAPASPPTPEPEVGLVPSAETSP